MSDVEWKDEITNEPEFTIPYFKELNVNKDEICFLSSYNRRS